MRKHAVESSWRSLYNRMLTHGGSDHFAGALKSPRFTSASDQGWFRIGNRRRPDVTKHAGRLVEADTVFALVLLCLLGGPLKLKRVQTLILSRLIPGHNHLAGVVKMRG